MKQFLFLILAQIVFVFAWAFAQAKILQNRAMAQKRWQIEFRDAYKVSVKSGLGAALIADVLVIAVAFTVGTGEDLIQGVAILAGVLAWWGIHSNQLLALAGPSSLMDMKTARSISASVFGYVLAAFLAAGAIAVLIGYGISKVG